MNQRKKSPIADLPHGVGVCKARNGNRSEFWRVRLGKKFTGGATIQRDFSNLSRAKEWIESQRGQRTQIHSTALSPNQLAEAKSAFSLLIAAGMSLTEAVTFAIRHSRPTNGEKSVEEAITALLRAKEKAGLTPQYAKQLGWCLRRFERDHSKDKIHEITSEGVEEWLEEEDFQPVNRKNYLRDLKMLFRFSVKQGWCAADPTESLVSPRIPDAEICVLSAEDAGNLLTAAQSASSDGMCAAIAIKLFAGLRTSEVRNLDWADVKVEEIVVQGKIAKSRQRRVVPMSTNLAAWLLPHRQINGPVAPIGWRDRYERLQVVSEVTLPKNVLRHTFGTYFYASHRDEAKTASAMGNSPDMIFRHYRGIVESASAKAFWKLSPSQKSSRRDADDGIIESIVEKAKISSEGSAKRPSLVASKQKAA